MPVAVTAILEFFKTLFSNKWFWIALAVLVAILLISKYWNQISRLFQRSDIDLLPGESATISVARRAELKSLASDLYQAIYATQNVGTAFREDKFIEATNLSDNELQFVSKYYRKSLTKGSWLYADVDDESMPFSAVDEELMARLTKVGEKG